MKKELLIACAASFLFQPLRAQNTWTQKTDFGGTARRSAIGFSIGNSGYLGTGYNSNFYDDLWKYDPVNDVWTQVASFPGAARFSAVAFVIGINGYVGTGYDVNNNFNTADFWKYDALSNIWSQSASLPAGQERRYACAFSAQGKGYVGTGAGSAGYLNDLWQYDESNNSWTQKADFPGAPRYECVSFAIGEFGYIGCGAFAGTIYQDFYEYQPQSDTWYRRADYPGAGGDAAAGFALEGRGFVGTGSTQGTYPVDFYEWDQLSDTWTAKANFPAAGRAFGTGFSILTKGYVGMGESSTYFNDWWEYTPDSLFNPVRDNHAAEQFPELIYYHGQFQILNTTGIAGLSRVTLYSMEGSKLTTLDIMDQRSFPLSGLATGIYIYMLAGKTKSITGKIFVTGE